jgi:hypothetical protein
MPESSCPDSSVVVNTAPCSRACCACSTT